MKFLGSIGNSRAVRILLRALNDKSRYVKNAALEAIEKLYLIDAEPFMRGLKDEDFKVRTSAADYLGRIRNPVAVNALISALCDDRIEVVRAASKSLGEIKDRRALYPLRNLLRNTDNKTREIVLDAISKIGGHEGVEIMINILLKDKDFARDIAEEKLFEMGSDTFLPIALLLEDMSEKERNAALRILTRYGDRAVDYFISGLETPDMKVKKASIIALGFIRATGALGVLEDLVSSEEKEIKETAKAAIKNIKKRKKRKFGPSFIFSSSLIDRVSTFFSSTITVFKNVGRGGREVKRIICGQCGGLITGSSSVNVAGLDFGKCSRCGNILCKNCAVMSLIGDGKTSISCPKCGVELDEVF